MVLVCKLHILWCCFFIFFQRLTGKSPDNLEELRDIALDVDEDELEDSELAGQSEDEDSDYSQSDAEEEEETSDHEQAGPSGEPD